MRHSRYKKHRQNVKIKREHKGIRYDDLLMLQMVEIFEDGIFVGFTYIANTKSICIY